MCGIAGIYYFDTSRRVDEGPLTAMIDRLAHRGPNGSGIFVDRHVGLGHRRLSVIDVENGTQPMIDPASGRAIVYNGEFYNYEEHRTRLAALGQQFRTRSDTEVLLRLAERDVLHWIHQVNGMFAFAVWNPRTRELTVVRDRFGVKPLYYTATRDGVAFASEIKALLQVPCGVAPSLDPQTVNEYLAFRHVLEPRTLFRDVKQLPSGHLMRLRPGATGPEIGRYWTEHDAANASATVDSTECQFRGIFSKAVRRRLISDVPLGTFNSGGVDSSLVTGEVRRQTQGDLHTFSVGFAESEYDESAYAQEVARDIGSFHHAEQLSAARYAELLPKAIWHHDEPLCHPHSVHLMHLSAIASRYVTVVLTGEGADEVFFGYPRLHIARAARRLAVFRSTCATGLNLLSRMTGSRRGKKLADVLGQPIPAEIDSHRFLPVSDLHLLCGATDYSGARTGELASVSRDQSLLEFLLEYERRSYMKSLLIRLDKMTMAHGLEARTPFLDFELVLWSKNVHAQHKIGWGVANKRLLKQLAAREFSGRLANRAKVGFGVPLRDWFRSESAFVELLSSLSSPNCFIASCLPHDSVRTLIAEHVAKGVDHTEALWALLNMEIWGRTMLRETPLEP